MSDILKVVTVATPDGDFHLIVDGDSLVRVSGYGDIESLHKRLPEELRAIELRMVKHHPYQEYIREYYHGDGKALGKIPYVQTGTDFQQKVWKTIAAIPYGTTISYKQLAKESENEAAIRAAGTICGLNRLILLVPCHRVRKSDGGIGSYLYGTALKESLLRREGSI